MAADAPGSAPTAPSLGIEIDTSLLGEPLFSVWRPKRAKWASAWEPSGEPSAADVEPHRACCTVRFWRPTRHPATVGHIGRW